MTETETLTAELRSKVQKLINLHERLQKDHEKLRQEDAKLQEQSESLMHQVKDLEEKNKVLKMAQNISGSDQNSRDMKLKINEYIREIDRCLALINR